jgi:hypothetical protein
MSRLLAENASHHNMLTDLRAGSASIAKTSLREVTPRQPADQPGEPLTKREHEVLTLVAQGLTDHGIAERDCSVNELDSRLRELKREIGYRTIDGLVERLADPGAPVMCRAACPRGIRMTTRSKART